MPPLIDVTAARVALECKHSSPLIGCRFDPSGRFLFVSAQDNSIQRFDISTGRKTEFKGHSSWSRGMAYVGMATPVSSAERMRLTMPHPHGPLQNLLQSLTVSIPKEPAAFSFISGDYLGEIRWWDGRADKPTPIRVLHAHEGWVRALDVSPDGRLLVSCGNDRLVKLWNAVEGTAIRTIEGHESHVYNVAFHPNGKTLVSADLKGNIKEWDVANGKHLRDLDAKLFHKYDATFWADIGGIRGMEFSADGQRLACVGITNVSNAFAGVGNPLVMLFDMKDGKARQLKTKDAFQGTGWGVGFLANGHIVAAGGAGRGQIWFWKPDDNASMHKVDVPANARDLAVHPDGTAFAIACFNGSAYVYTVTPGPVPPKKK